MTTTRAPAFAPCPTCGQNMRREVDGARRPPLPQVLWFCANPSCPDGQRNRTYHGG